MAESATILIPDISGYTEFLTKTELVHSSHIINGLLEAILAANDTVLKTSYPMLPAESIRQDVATTRANGYALNPGLIYANSWGIGVAVLTPDGRPAGALSIAAIDSRMQPARQAELAALLTPEARRVEEKLAQMFAARNQQRNHVRRSAR